MLNFEKGKAIESEDSGKKSTKKSSKQADKKESSTSSRNSRTSTPPPPLVKISLKVPSNRLDLEVEKMENGTKVMIIVQIWILRI